MADTFMQIDRRSAIGMLTGALAAATGGCREMFPNKFRFRTTVEVDTPQGLRSGSGVMEISAALATFKLPDSHAVNVGFKGEAVVIDLPGSTLFMLVGDSPSLRPFDGTVIDTFANSHPREGALVDLVGELGAKKSLGRSATISRKYFPKFVRFRDRKDMRSVEIVDPDRLDMYFEKGIFLKSILLTVVSDPVTSSILTKIPKFDDNYAKWYINLGVSDQRQITRYDFRSRGMDL